MFAAPTIVRRLVDHAGQPGLVARRRAQSFKTIVYGGAPMYVADIQRALAVMGPRFVQIYGQGETPMVGTALARRPARPRPPAPPASASPAVGVAQTPVRVRVDRRPRASDCRWARPGEVVVRGDSVMAGYWRNPEASAEAPCANGWLWTGDMGTLDADGYLTLKDRSKDLIISGGSNIYPREVEEALLTAPGVAEVAVVGEPDAEWGEVVVAFVVAPSRHRRRHPKRWTPTACSASPASSGPSATSSCPRTKLPKNNYGKVLKTDDRKHLRPVSAF
jgi:long-chain acyl-CoA synthetase